MQIIDLLPCWDLKDKVPQIPPSFIISLITSLCENKNSMYMEATICRSLVRMGREGGKPVICKWQPAVE
jgi:hypothetical protein